MTVHVFGSGGHAKVIIDALLANNIERILLVCDYSNESHLLGFPIIRTKQLYSSIKPSDAYHLGIGNILLRQKANGIARRVGLTPLSIIHPKAYVSKLATINDGVFIGPFAHVGVNCNIGKHTIVNTGATVEHDSFVADFCHLAPSTTLLGGAKIHTNCFIGANSVVLPKRVVNKNSCIGANSLVNKDIPNNSKAFGSPIRLQN